MAQPTAEAILPDVTPCPGPALDEWRRNLRASAHTFIARRPVNLVNVESGAVVESIAAGAVAVAYETVVGGREYWMTAYSVDHGLPNGILKSEMTAAAAAPVSSPPASPPALPASILGTEWSRLPTDRKVVALTFDAGANADGVSRILKALADARVPATFFLTGQWVEHYPADARLIASRYAVGDHTYSHPSLPGLTDAQVGDEIDHGAAVIRSVTGHDPHPLFRFPYGARDDRTIAIVNQHRFGAVRWTVDTLGWKGASSGQTTDSVFNRTLGALQPGEIVIMHVGSAPDGSALDADALPRVIAEIQRRGYSFVSVRDFL